MKAVYFQGNEKVLIKDISIPKLQGGDVLVRVKSSAICGSDMKRYYSRSPHEIIEGHEICGTIVDSKSARWCEEENVVTYALSGCGICPACRSGARMQCDNLNYVLGGFSEYIAVKENDCLPLPEWMNHDDGAILGDCAGLAFHTLKRQNACSGQRVLIIGLGPVGMGMGLMANAMGLKNIVADINSFRVNLAKKLELGHVIDLNTIELDKALANTPDIDIAIDCAGREATQLACMRHCRKNGKVALVAGNTRLTLNPIEFFLTKELQVSGSWYYNFKEYKNITEFIKDKYQPSCIITHHFMLDEAQQAFELFASGNCCKVVLHP